MGHKAMKYVTIYAFEAMERVAEGKAVFMLDKEWLSVVSVNEMCVSQLAEVLKETDRTGRFEFWYEEGE